MTREEAIYHLKTYDDPIKVHEAFNMAIKALKQEPCEDTVSRQNIIDKYKLCADMLSDEELKGANLVMEWVNNASSVRPQEQTGKWIEHHNQTRFYFKCSNCKTLHDEMSNYCPFCGIRMNGNYKGLTKIIIGENDVI